VPELLDEATLLRALRLVGEKLARQGKRAEIYIFGGSCMVLAFKSRPATREIDAIFEPDTEVHTAAVEVAAELGLPRYWLNNQASVYLSRLPDEGKQIVLDEPGIRAFASSGEFAFAMKVLAGRRLHDRRDIDFLARRLGVQTVDEAMAVVRRVYPEADLKDHARLLLEDILAEIQGEEGRPSQ
jgi:hypothetical protein